MCRMMYGMNAEFRHLGNLPFDTAEDLRLRLALIDAERAKLLKALEAYSSDPVEDSWIGADLDLHDLPVKEAAVALLRYADDHDRPDMSAGEMEAALRKYRVRTARSGRLASETKGIWMLLVRVLTSPANSQLFTVERSGSGVRRTDRVSLAESRKKGKR
jgi:hypothetical protein